MARANEYVARDRTDALVMDSWRGFGGGERYVLDLCTHLATRLSVVVGCVDDTLADRAGSSVRVVRMRYWGRQLGHLAMIGHLLLWPLVLLDQLALHLRAGRPRATHIVTFEEQLLATILHRLLGSRVTWSVHGPPPISNRVQAWLYRAAARHTAQVIAVSQGIKNSLVALGLDDETVLVIANGVDVPSSMPPRDLTSRRPIRVGFVGRLEPIKDPELFVMASAELGNRTDVEFVIFGAGSQRDHLESLIASSDGATVRLSGYVSDPAQLWSDLDVLLLTSRSEGMPFAVLEAGAAGVPCVSVDIPAAREVIVDGVTGVICDRNPSAISEVLRNLLDQPESIVRLGKAARCHVGEKFRRDHSLDASLRALIGSTSEHS